MNAAKRLNKTQLELLKLFSLDLSEEQLKEIKSLLIKYFAEKVTLEMDNLFEAKGWDEKKIEEWSKEHMRTKYKDK